MIMCSDQFTELLRLSEPVKDGQTAILIDFIFWPIPEGG